MGKFIFLREFFRTCSAWWKFADGYYNCLFTDKSHDKVWAWNNDETRTTNVVTVQHKSSRGRLLLGWKRIPSRNRKAWLKTANTWEKKQIQQTKEFMFRSIVTYDWWLIAWARRNILFVTNAPPTNARNNLYAVEVIGYFDFSDSQIVCE